MARTTSSKGRRSSLDHARNYQVNRPRSRFPRSHSLKTAMDSGFLVPIFADEVLPGDTHILKPTLYGRFATPINPIMDNVYLETHYWFVPLRLIWDNSEEFFGAEPNGPGTRVDRKTPKLSLSSVPAGSLSDYLGVPVNQNVGAFEVCAFWHRAYNLIFNEWYAVGYIDPPLPVPKSDGPDDIGDYTLVRRRKRHDYFTSALPSPQAGDPVELPLGGTAPLIGDAIVAKTGIPTFQGQVGGGGQNALYWDNSADNIRLSSGSGTPITDTPMDWDNPNLAVDLATVSADLSNATATTINELRNAFSLQRLLEAFARGG